MNLLCEEILQAITECGFGREHLKLLIQEPMMLRLGLRFAISQIALKQVKPGELSFAEGPSGEVIFTQNIVPLPISAKEWELFFQQFARLGNGKFRCHFDRSMNLFNSGYFDDILHPDTSSIVLVETDHSHLTQEQACEIAEHVAPKVRERTKPSLIFEVLRNIGGLMSEVNAAYILVGQRVRGAHEFPVLFNHQTEGQKLTLVKGIPKQQEPLSGYYAFCG